jgi:hypothetical protein
MFSTKVDGSRIFSLPHVFYNESMMTRMRVFCALRRGFSFLLTLCLLAAAGGGVIPRPALAASGLVTGITVQNLSGNAANVTITFYNPDGSVVSGATIQTSLGPHAQATWYVPAHTNLPPGFVGSAVVTADQPIAAITNVQTPSSAGTSPNDPIRIGTGLGVSAGQASPTLYIPQIMRSYAGWNSQIFVQNTSGSPATVTVTYRDRYGQVIAGASEQVVIPAWSTHIFDQAANSALGTVLGSAVIQSNGAPLAGWVNLFNQGTSSDTAQLMTYNAATAGGTKLYAPRLLNNYYGFNSGLTIQNLSGSAPAHATITFYFANGYQRDLGVTINPYASAALYLPSVQFPDGSGLPSGNALGKGAAIITSDQPIAAIVNEDNRVTPDFIGQGTSYNAIPDGTQGTSLYFPQVVSRYYSYASGLTIQNVGTAPGSGTLVLTDRSGRSLSFPTGTIPPGGEMIYFIPNLWPDADFNGSASVSFSQPIVGIENMSYRGDVDPRYAAGRYGDSLSSYVGVASSQ